MLPTLNWESERQHLQAFNDLLLNSIANKTQSVKQVLQNMKLQNVVTPKDIATYVRDNYNNDVERNLLFNCSKATNDTEIDDAVMKTLQGLLRSKSCDACRIFLQDPTVIMKPIVDEALEEYRKKKLATKNKEA